MIRVDVVKDEPDPEKDEFDLMREKYLPKPKRKGNRPKFWPLVLKPGHEYMPGNPNSFRQRGYKKV